MSMAQHALCSLSERTACKLIRSDKLRIMPIFGRSSKSALSHLARPPAPGGGTFVTCHIYHQPTEPSRLLSVRRRCRAQHYVRRLQ